MLSAPFVSNENASVNPFKVPGLPYRFKLWEKVTEQLFILTGVKASHSNKNLAGESCEPYFRLSFATADKGLHTTQMLLELFGIDCFKECTDKEAEGLIGVRDSEVKKLNALFVPLQTNEPSQPEHTLKVDNLHSRQRLALVNFLFSYQNSGDLEERNNDKYDLSRIMLRVVDFVTHSLTSMDYLRNKGFACMMTSPTKPDVFATTPVLPITTAFHRVKEGSKKPDVTDVATLKDEDRLKEKTNITL